MLGTKTKVKATKNGQLNGLNGMKETGETCVISAGTVIEGKFVSSENVRLDGTMKGEMKC